jgi:hypothetical protein
MFESFSLDSPISPEQLIPVVEIADDETDPRLTRTSYSSNLSLHACPRLFQLEKLQAEKIVDYDSNVTFAFGHVVGDGIQQYLIHRDLDKTIWSMFLGWHADFADENERQKKSFASATAALMMFAELCEDGLLDEYEVAYFNGKPAAELSFKIIFPHTEYRGYVDLVLRHKLTGEYLILELKTTSAKYIRHSQYKNSAQALGYSVVLDKIAPGCTSYGVLYLVYLTLMDKFEPMEFPKTFHQRAMWLRDMLWDDAKIAGLIEDFGSYGTWPMHGESCNRFNRDCNFMDMCQGDTKFITAPLKENQLVESRLVKDIHTGKEHWEPVEYDFTFRVEELLA